jgi:epoxyqueuosine reductase QueG
MNKMLTEEVKFKARQLGAKLVGIASADNFEGVPEGFHPRDTMKDATCVIVMGVPLLYGVVEKATPFKPYETYIHEHNWKWGMPNRSYAMQYVSLNAKSDLMTQELSYMLEDKGYHCFPIPMSTPCAGMGTEPSVAQVEYTSEGMEKYLRGDISHRHAAVIAGLGEFGLNNMLLTPEYGPRVRLTSVITTAPLVPDKPFSGKVCIGKQDPNKCKACVKACPFDVIPDSMAPIDNPFGYNKNDKFKCYSKTAVSLAKILDGWVHAICAICMKACPVGKRLPSLKKNQTSASEQSVD